MYRGCRRSTKSGVKYLGLTEIRHLILMELSSIEEDRILGVAVKCVDIEKNTSGVGGLLGRN